MRQLTKSMLRLGWTAPLYGAAQLAGAFGAGSPAGRRPGVERLGSSLDAITWTGQRRLGWTLQALFQAGDDLGSEWLDRFFDALEPQDRPLSPLAAGSRVASVAVEMAGRATDTARILATAAVGGAARQEWLNKLEVYRLVRGVRRRLGLPSAGQPFELNRFVRRALNLDPYCALWVIEGLGHDYAAWILDSDPDPAGILAGEDPPPAALLMLHAGLGLALAEHVLGELTPGDPEPGSVERAIERFLELCEANSRHGFADAAIESLGLVVRCFFPDLVRPVDLALARAEGSLHGYFWHGVGRAIYFLPVNFLPGYGSIEHAIAMARREAPHPASRRNAVAGVAYAVALVNLSHPEVLEDLVRRHSDLFADGAFGEGLISSLLMRRATTPGDPGLATFLRHRPAASDARLGQRWQELIAAPVARAFADPEGAFARSGSGEVYRAVTRRGEFEGLTTGGTP